MTTTTKERGRIFTAQEVRGIQAGNKVQFREAIKPQPVYEWDAGCFEAYDKLICEFYEPVIVGKDGEEREGKTIYGAYTEDGEWGIKSPYAPGDIIWVKETWRETGNGQRADGKIPKNKVPIVYAADDPTEGPWRSPVHMPRWASRFTLEVTDVRVELDDGVWYWAVTFKLV